MVKNGLVTSLLCIVCVFGGWLLGSEKIIVPLQKDIPDLHNEHANGSYRFTNQLLACGDINSLNNGAMLDLRTTVESTLEHQTKSGSISKASIYVRDLDNGPWMGIGEKDLYYPASLLKLPLLIALYKHEEDVPGFLDKEVLYKGPVLQNVTLLYPPAQILTPGKKYSIRELARRAIVYSDNEAAALAGNELGFTTLTQVFSDLGIQDPEPGEDYQTSARTYASFFRVLYNASYMNRSLSEEALRVLSESQFTDGITVGIPTNVTVAHKFGEREGMLDNGNVQLHDCGIIYSPGRPYLLCIMAQAKTTAAILDLMHTISREVYDVMSKP